MKLQKNYSLKNLNTFRIDVSARYYTQVNSINDIVELIGMPEYKNQDKLVLGGGANILFTKNYDGLVIKIGLKGISTVREDKNKVYIEVAAGENWHKFVMYTVEKGLGGIENMVFIPGTVGAAAVQNIAAYGQNLSDVFVKLRAIDLETGKIKTFTKKECGFSYRESRFKHRDRGRYIVVSVTVLLNKHPRLNTNYFETGKSYAKNVSLAALLGGKETLSVKDVAMAVMKIRKNKLPDVRKVGTAGSFFKNPVVAIETYRKLKQDDQDLQCYPLDGLRYENIESLMKQKKVKIPAARLLDNLGWKGKRIGSVGTHTTQALAVVNYGASPQDILNFVAMMKNEVYMKYGIRLEEEVLII